MKGYWVYVLFGPRQPRGQGTLRHAGDVLDRQRSFHAIRVECDGMNPVPIYGILA
jgi:hypothetical protein